MEFVVQTSCMMFKFTLKKFKYRVRLVWPGSGIPYKIIQTNKLHDIIHELNKKKLDIHEKPHEYPHEIQDIPIFSKRKYQRFQLKICRFSTYLRGWDLSKFEFRIIDVPTFIYNRIPWECIILHFSKTLDYEYTKATIYDYDIRSYSIIKKPNIQYWRSFEDIQYGFEELHNYIQNKPKVTDPKILQFLKTKL